MKKTKEEILADYKNNAGYFADEYPVIGIKNAAKCMQEYAAQFTPVWIDVKGIANIDQSTDPDMERTMVLFDNGNIRFYMDETWPFTKVVGYFILPQPPTK